MMTYILGQSEIINLINFELFDQFEKDKYGKILIYNSNALVR
jgi:hypothetical protein